MLRCARPAILSLGLCGLMYLRLPAQTPPSAPDQQAQPAAPPATQPAAQEPAQDPAQQPQPAAEPAHVSPASPDTNAQPEAKQHHKDKAEKKDKDKPLPQGDIHNASLWHDPGNIAAKDLFYGQGGDKHQPVPPFTFEDEDLNGTNPKVDVRDAKDVKWRVKLGEEARPEVVASRLLWAVGYYANDDYLLHVATIEGLHMQRGGKRIHNGSQIIDVRFSRKPPKETKIGIWQWKGNPFQNTREFNGLRVMMAVLNDWDLKDVNNAVYTDKKTGHQIFLVSDVGATFATNNLQMSRAQDKGNVANYQNSKFITHTTQTTVDFGTPSAPTGVLIKSVGLMAGDYFKRAGFDWIGRGIPREDAKWVGGLLGQLSQQQITDAFRAGNFPPESIQGYVDVLEERITALKAL
jgi:hypothetical protein